MSDGIDAALDSAFESIVQVKEAHLEAIEDGVLPPTALSTNGLFEQAKKLAADKKAARTEKAKADKADKRTKAEIREEGLDSSLDKALAKSSAAQKERKQDRAAEATGDKPRPMSSREFNDPEVVKHRRELRERFGNVKLSERMTQFEKWEESFKRDPAGTREAIMNEYLKFTPHNFPKSKADKAGKDGNSLGDSVDFATESAGEYADLKPFADKYGEKLPHLLRQLNEIEKDLIADPVGASARLAANYGALDAPQQRQPAAQSQPSPAALHPHYEGVSHGLQRCIELNELPGLELPEVQEAIALVLDAGMVPRTQDRYAALKAAHAIVVGRFSNIRASADLPGTHAAPARTTAPPKGNGQKSIHGGPNAPSARGRRGTLDSALNKAFGRV